MNDESEERNEVMKSPILIAALAMAVSASAARFPRTLAAAEPPTSEPVGAEGGRTARAELKDRPEGDASAPGKAEAVAPAKHIAALLTLIDPKQTPDAKIRKTVIEALGAQGPQDPPLIEALIRAVSLYNEPEASVRIAAIKTLDHLGVSSPELTTSLAQTIYQGRAYGAYGLDEMRAAAWALRKANLKDVKEGTMWFFNHAMRFAADADVRWNLITAAGLGKANHEHTVYILSLFLNYDKDAGVRARAAWALGQVGDPENRALEALSDVFKRGHEGDPGVLQCAAVAIACRKDPRSCQALECVLKGNITPELKETIQMALENLKNALPSSESAQTDKEEVDAKKQ